MRLHMDDRIVKSDEKQKEEIALVENPKGEGKAPKNIKRLVKRYKAVIILGALAVGIIILFVWSISVYSNAKEAGSRAGEALGSAAGRAVGSFQGITEKIPEGMAAGKEEGLSAKDTEVNIRTEIERMGSLEVLKAGVKLESYLDIADDYRAVFVYKAEATFSVNLRDAEIVGDEPGKVTISLAKPSVEVHIDDTETDKIAEWQRHFYSGSTEDAYRAYIDARAQVENKAPEEITHYDTLMEMARDSAKKQVSLLAEAVCGDRKVEIIFTDE